MTKWEYLEIRPRTALATGDDDWMNKLGANGWQLVSVDNGITYFRRPKITVGPSETKTEAPSEGPSV